MEQGMASVTGTGSVSESKCKHEIIGLSLNQLESNAGKLSILLGRISETPIEEQKVEDLPTSLYHFLQENARMRIDACNVRLEEICTRMTEDLF